MRGRSCIIGVRNGFGILHTVTFVYWTGGHKLNVDAMARHLSSPLAIIFAAWSWTVQVDTNVSPDFVATTNKHNASLWG